MADEVAIYTEYDARVKAAELRMKHGTDQIQAEDLGEHWVIAKYENDKRFVLTKPKWHVVR